MPPAPEGSALAAIRARARRLSGNASDFDLLLERIGDAAIVLLGEASHGTHEFYRIRAEITKRLILERGRVVVDRPQTLVRRGRQDGDGASPRG